MKQDEVLASRDLFNVLCVAAGVDHLRVKSINCRCAVDSFAEFDVEMRGEAEHIRKMIPREEAPSN